jgi:toxin CptA
MHSAPSVSYPVGRSRFAAALALLAWLLGVVVIAIWWSQSPSAGWRLWGAWAVLAAAGVFTLWSWWRCVPGVLAWDGETWSWSSAGGVHTGTLEVGLDLQRWLLLRCACGNATHWLWVERASLTERWDDLRRAIYSRARLQALRQDRQPAAKP